MLNREPIPRNKHPLQHLANRPLRLQIPTRHLRPSPHPLRPRRPPPHNILPPRRHHQQPRPRRARRPRPRRPPAHGAQESGHARHERDVLLDAAVGPAGGHADGHYERWDEGRVRVVGEGGPDAGVCGGE